MDHDTSALLAGVKHSAYKKYLERMRYSRALFLADTVKNADCLAEIRRFKLSKRAKRQKIKNKLLFPLKCAKFIAKRLFAKG